MHACKTFLSSLYICAAWLISAVCLWQLAAGQWLWLGVLLTWLPLPLVNGWRRYYQPLYREDEREWLASALSLLGLAVLLMAGQRDLPLALGGLGIACLLLYRFWLTSVKPGWRTPTIDIAQLADAEFSNAEFTDAAGQRVTIKQWRGQPLVLVFMRGQWCPFSALVYRDTLALGDQLAECQTLLIYPHAAPSGIVPANMQLLADNDNKVAQQTGLLLRGGTPWWWRWRDGIDAQRPALALINSDGECVLWQQASNYRLPPVPRQYLARLFKSGGN